MGQQIQADPVVGDAFCAWDVALGLILINKTAAQAAK
jgi:hypothetical protein